MTTAVPPLPDAVALYLRADADDGADPVEACFAPDARVRDEGRSFHGRDEIRAWRREARARYRYRVEPLAVARRGDALSVRVRVAGDFPGSPVELEYAIVLAADGRIAALEIG